MADSDGWEVSTSQVVRPTTPRVRKRVAVAISCVLREVCEGVPNQLPGVGVVNFQIP